MDAFVNTMKGHAASQVSAQGQPRRGIVTSYNPADNTVQVMFQPEGTSSGWLPIEGAGSTSGGGIQFGPTIGSQCKITPGDGDVDSGSVSGFMHSDVDPAPGAPSGECWIVHPGTGGFVKLTNDGHITATDASGSTIKLTNDGNVTAISKGGATVLLSTNGSMTFTAGAGGASFVIGTSGTIFMNANVVINGALSVEDDITYLNGAHGTVGQLQTAYDVHTHPLPGVQAGSGAPNTSTTSNPV